MSADNYLWVAERNGRFVIVDRSASCEYPLHVRPSEHVISEHDSAAEAVCAAHNLNHGPHWTEYGVSLSPITLAALDQAGDRA